MGRHLLKEIFTALESNWTWQAVKILYLYIQQQQNKNNI